MDFNQSNSLFSKSNKLLVGSIYSELKDNLDKSLLYISSPFKDQWYNFMVPLVESNHFDWKYAETTIEKESLKGRKISYYVHSSLKDSYEKELKKRGYSDGGDEIYIYKKISGQMDGCGGSLVPVNNAMLEKYVEMSCICFPDWDNNEEYSRMCYDFDSSVKSREFPAFVLQVDGECVASGALLLSTSQDLSLGYIHNTGTLPEHRRKGYFSCMIKEMCNYLRQKGINEVYAIVEEDSGSYHGFKKLGFDVKEKFYLYVKED